MVKDGQRWSKVRWSACWHHPWSLASMCCANVTCHLSVWTVESVLLRQVHANQDSGDAVSGIPGFFFRFLRQFRQFVVPSKKQNMYVILCIYYIIVCTTYINLLQMNVLWGFGQVWGVHLIWEANLRSSGRHCECAGTGLWRYGSLALCCVR